MQTSGDYARAFDVQRKEDFLRVYRANGLAFYKTCKDLGLSHHTLNHHVKNDPAFAAELRQVEREFSEELEAKSRTIALSKDSATLERIFHLRAFFPEKYAKDLKQDSNERIQINVVGDVLISQKKKLDAVDTTIVREIESANTDPIPDTFHQSPQLLESSTETNSSREQSPSGDAPNQKNSFEVSQKSTRAGG